MRHILARCQLEKDTNCARVRACLPVKRHQRIKPAAPNLPPTRAAGLCLDPATLRTSSRASGTQGCCCWGVKGPPLQGARFSKSKAHTPFSSSSAHTRVVCIGFYPVFRSFRIPETFSATGSRSVFIVFYQVFRSFRIPETFSAIGSRSVFVGFYQVFRSFRIPETIPETFSAIGLRVHTFCFHCFFAGISEL